MKHKRIPALCAILVMALLMHGCENKSKDATSSVTGDADYLSLMEKNLEALKEVLR